VHNFIGAPNGKSSEAVHITPASTPLSVLLLFFAEIVRMLVVETNSYYHQFLDNFEDGPSPQREVTEAEMFLFLALTLPAAASNNTRRLDTHHNKHWPGSSNTKWRCRVCSVGGVKQTVILRCVKCDVALCVDRKCFEDYHTKTNL